MLPPSLPLAVSLPDPCLTSFTRGSRELSSFLENEYLSVQTYQLDLGSVCTCWSLGGGALRVEIHLGLCAQRSHCRSWGERGSWNVASAWKDEVVMGSKAQWCRSSAERLARSWGVHVGFTELRKEGSLVFCLFPSLQPGIMRHMLSNVSENVYLIWYLLSGSCVQRYLKNIWMI